MNNLEVYTGLKNLLEKQPDAMMHALMSMQGLYTQNQILTRANDLLAEENMTMRKRLSEINENIDLQTIASTKTLAQQATQRPEAKAVADYLRSHAKSNYQYQNDLEMFTTYA